MAKELQKERKPTPKQMQDRYHTVRSLHTNFTNQGYTDAGENEAPRLTLHADRRIAARGISPGMLHSAIQFGETIHRQGLIFYILRKKDLPGWLEASLSERLTNLVVVTA